MNLTFLELPAFSRKIVEFVDNNDYRVFQNQLGEAPERWPVVPGSGGLRKARMRLPGRGKSGGARVLYLYFPRHQAVVFFLMYAKSEIENIPKNQLRKIHDEVQNIKKEFESFA
jgi:hypothetical protein